MPSLPPGAKMSDSKSEEKLFASAKKRFSLQNLFLSLELELPKENTFILAIRGTGFSEPPTKP